VTTQIIDLRGISDAAIKKLKALNIKDSDQFLEASKTPAQRKSLAKQVDVSLQEILRLANSADLSRIKGVGGVFSDLLEKTGVDTVKELAMRRADNLHDKITEINSKEALVKQAPSIAQVEKWVSEAKSLPRGIEY
jgi:nucleotidyltransferase/DNA polymerase involved in DNA repair